MKIHSLKTWSKFFEPLQEGKKSFEYRLDDRDFKTGDTLLLREWHPIAGYTGRYAVRHVSYVLKDEPEIGLPNGFCILSLINAKHSELMAAQKVLNGG